MNANCLNDKGEFKSCPYRVFTEEHKAIAIGSGDCVTQHFYPCVGEQCIAYHVGLCMRVQEALTNVEKSR